MEENLVPEGKSLEEHKNELDRKKFEENRKLVAKANQMRAFCYAHNPEFFDVGKEECELLEKYFPQEAKRLKEKFAKEKKKDERHPGSVKYSDLLYELEGLANKAFKTMLENMKSQKKPADKEKKQEPTYNEYEIAQMEMDLSKSKKEHEETKRESAEAEKNRPAQTKTITGAKGALIEDMEDSYQEGYTGKKVVRTKEVKTNQAISRKEQKKLEKQQKKIEKQQKKLEKAKKGNKVSAVSLDEINKLKNEMNQGSAQQTENDAKKLKAYQDSLSQRVGAKESSGQENGQAQEQSMGMSREYNPPTPSSSTKPKK